MSGRTLFRGTTALLAAAGASLSGASLAPSLAAAAPDATPKDSAAASAVPNASPIRVAVNGEMVGDLEHAPVIRGGAMLIPLNGILDRMAVTVAWETLTRKVDIRRGATHVQLTIGSAEALVNGKPQAIDAAPEAIGDAIMVPLRFLADSLGFYTSWDRSNRLVSISTAPEAGPSASSAGQRTTVTHSDGALTGNVAPVGGLSTGPAAGPAPAYQGSGEAQLPPVLPPSVSGGSGTGSTVAPSSPESAVTFPDEQGSGTLAPSPQIPYGSPDPGTQRPGTSLPPALPPVGEADTITGQAARVERTDNGTFVTLTGPGGDIRYPVAADAIVLSRDSRGARHEAQLEDLVPGDNVVLRLDARQEATVLEISYQQAHGTLQAVANQKLLLADGQVVRLAPDAAVILPGGMPGRASDLRRGDAVSLRINPTTGQAYRIDSSSAAGMPTSDGVVPSQGSLIIENPGPYRAGDALTVTIHAAPGETASFQAPGMRTPVPMKEYEPGVYKGRLVVPPGLSAQPGPVIGQISRDGAPVGTLRSNQAVVVDSTPPAVEQLTPAPGKVETNHQRALYAVFTDRGGTGVDPSSVHLTLNGQDVTAQCQVTDSFVACSGLTLPDGRNRAVLSLRDRAGNFTLAPWEFDVSSLDDPIQRISFSTSRTKTGERLTVRVDGRAGGDATFDLGTNWLGQPMKEIRPGRYEGTLVLERGDRAADLPVTAHLQLGDQVATRISQDLVTFMDGRPGVPTIDSPAPGVAIEPPLVVSGHADPGVQVHVKVEYNSRVFAMLGTRGLASEETVTADDTGAWRTGTMALATLVPNSHHIVYRITAEALNAAGSASKSVSVTVYRDR